MEAIKLFLFFFTAFVGVALAGLGIIALMFFFGSPA
jgi:hypothetical protein